uniref:F-box domain-containing protein n=1 Tax=Arundo donax TaxID=35708 RepID=A0A0A9EQZ3_ARUDO
MAQLSPSPAAAPVRRWADLPVDIALAIASRLQEADVCALGGCSRSWRSACDADCVWERLFRRRWPTAAAEAAAGGGEGPSHVQGWKALYINQHRRMAIVMSNVVEFVESSMHNSFSCFQ